MGFTAIPILQRRKPRLGEMPKGTKASSEQETVVLRTGFWKKGAIESPDYEGGEG